jgi:acyl-CoA dehydrogenase
VDFSFSESQNLLRESVRDLMGRFSPEYWRGKDERKEFPFEFEKASADLGLFGVMIPEEYGGSGLGVTEAAIILQQVADSSGALDACSVVHMGTFGINPLMLHGTPEQKREFLPRAAKGLVHSCFGVTEPDAGTDTSRITTFARREGDRYIVNGQKVWTSRGLQAEYILLLCRTTPADQVKKRFAGLTLLFAPIDRKAIKMRPIPKMGRNAVESCETFITDFEVPAQCLVGEEGNGFYHLLDGLNPERIFIAAEAVGLGYQAISRAVAYAKDRVVFGRPIGQNQGVQIPLAEAYSQLRAAELMMLRAAWLYDTGQPCGPEANMAKLRGTEAAHLAVNAAFETFGGYGYAKEYDIERLYRQLPLTRVAPITNTLVRTQVAEHALGLPKSY